MPEPGLFWLTVTLLLAAVTVGAVTLAMTIRLLARSGSPGPVEEDRRRLPPPTATA